MFVEWDACRGYRDECDPDPALMTLTVSGLMDQVVEQNVRHVQLCTCQEGRSGSDRRQS